MASQALDIASELRALDLDGPTLSEYSADSMDNLLDQSELDEPGPSPGKDILDDHKEGELSEEGELSKIRNSNTTVCLLHWLSISCPYIHPSQCNKLHHDKERIHRQHIREEKAEKLQVAEHELKQVCLFLSP
jgi:hypothetical protein